MAKKKDKTEVIEATEIKFQPITNSPSQKSIRRAAKWKRFKEWFITSQVVFFIVSYFIAIISVYLILSLWLGFGIKILIASIGIAIIGKWIVQNTIIGFRGEVND